ncbi:type 1 glutamine amidotransferase domain-containing protein [Gluconacetobacter sp. Hr-1-5]|uniref:type 1 glutamine amidotransferase domain-containing protein n=1 Tax=Gluconacetobacter sp. Hr-1-5 TaxID=3395370 RepID=UPI003B51D336
MSDLSGRSIAILATDGVEDVELVKPGEALREAGAFTVLVSPQRAEIQAMEADVHPARTYAVERPVAEARAEAFDGLVLPGGTTNPDQLRIDDASVAFVRHFVETGKPIAAICHGAWTLIEAGGVAGHRMTSWPSLRTDLRNAGAEWVDEEVVVDGKLVTSRRPDDLPAFCAAIVRLFAGEPAVLSA